MEKANFYGCRANAWELPGRGGVIVIIVAGVLLTGCRTALTSLPTVEKRNFGSLLEWAKQNGAPGSVLVVKTPKTNFIKAYGFADRDGKVAMTTNHSFRIASISKSFIGIAAAQAVAEGKLDLDKPITNYLSREITDRIANSDRITTRHLLRQTSGIYDFERSASHTIQRYLTDRRGKWTPERDLKFAFDKAADFAPGTAWRYSTTGFILAGMILDGIYGRDHSLEIRDRLLTPLGMTNTFCERTESARGTVARGYENWLGWWWTDVTEWAPMTGAMISTAPELARFIRAVTRNDGFLDETTRRIVWRNRDSGELRYDFGISLAQQAEHTPWFFGHAGAAVGYLSFAYHELAHDITIVYLTNTSHMKMRGLGKKREEFTRLLTTALFDLSLRNGTQ